MSNFLQLVYNEITKIYLRKSAWIMYIIVALLIFGFGSLNKAFSDEDTFRTLNDDWRDVLIEENESLLKQQEEVNQKLAAYDEKYGDSNQDEDGWDEERFDIELSSPDLSKIDKNNLYLEQDIRPSGYGAWQFVAENASILIIVSLLTIIVAAGIIAYEFRWGTIKVLLIRPISRTKIFFSKYVAVLIYALLTIIFVLITAWIIGAILFGIENSPPNMIVQSYAEISSMDSILQIDSTYRHIVASYGYSFIEIMIMATFAFMISAVFRNSTLAVGTSIFLVFTGNTVALSLALFEKDFAKYLLFTHMNFKQYADGHVLIEGMTIGFSITIVCIYYAIFMLLAWLAFVKRDVA